MIDFEEVGDCGAELLWKEEEEGQFLFENGWEDKMGIWGEVTYVERPCWEDGLEQLRGVDVL